MSSHDVILPEEEPWSARVDEKAKNGIDVRWILNFGFFCGVVSNHTGFLNIELGDNNSVYIP